MMAKSILRLALTSVVVASLATIGVGIAVDPAGAVPVAPYTDTNAAGYIGLCNQAGQQIYSGNISSTPFVWRAVSSRSAPAPYNNSARQAVLNAYLPLESIPPGDWSGEALTAGSSYTNAAVPMAQATTKDIPLSVFLKDFPPKWDGFIQLRMYFGTVGQTPLESQYPALNIYISGDTWTEVGGGQVNCTAGSAESIETIVLSPSTTAAGTNSGGVGQGGSSSKGSSSKGSSSKGAAGQADPGVSKPLSGQSSPTGSGRVISATESSTRGVPTVLIAVLIVLVVAALFVGRELVLRWRRAASASSETPSPKGTNA